MLTEGGLCWDGSWTSVYRLAICSATATHSPRKLPTFRRASRFVTQMCCAVPDTDLLQISQLAAFRNPSPLPSSGIKVWNPFLLAPVDGVSSVGVITATRKLQICSVGLCFSCLTWKWSHQLYNYWYLSAENVIIILACNTQRISAMYVPSVLFRCLNHTHTHTHTYIHVRTYVHTYRGGQKCVYSCEYAKHRFYSCIICVNNEGRQFEHLRDCT